MGPNAVASPGARLQRWRTRRDVVGVDNPEFRQRGCERRGDEPELFAGEVVRRERIAGAGGGTRGEELEGRRWGVDVGTCAAGNVSCCRRGGVGRRTALWLRGSGRRFRCRCRCRWHCRWRFRWMSRCSRCLLSWSRSPSWSLLLLRLRRPCSLRPAPATCGISSAGALASASASTPASASASASTFLVWLQIYSSLAQSLCLFAARAVGGSVFLRVRDGVKSKAAKNVCPRERRAALARMRLVCVVWYGVRVVWTREEKMSRRRIEWSRAERSEAIGDAADAPRATFRHVKPISKSTTPFVPATGACFLLLAEKLPETCCRSLGVGRSTWSEYSHFFPSPIPPRYCR